MTDREFYQAELIKCLEQIREEVDKLADWYYDRHCEDIAQVISIDVFKIIEKRIEKAKKIKEM